MSPKRASSKANTFSGFPGRRSRLRLRAWAKFFEGLLLFWVGFLVPGTTRLELYLASPQKLADAVGVGALDTTALSKELVGLTDGSYIPPLHGLLQVLEGFGRD